jgi:SAM-dependent methyltransferase
VREWLQGSSLEVSREIAPNDPMLYDPSIYFVAGHWALRWIQLAMLATGRNTVESALDLACGAGRVMRTLRAAFPDASLTACDIWEEGVRFCERTFGARGVISEPNPGDLQFDEQFDVIWCGSMLTHLGPDPFLGTLRLFESSLTPNGIVVFTLHGRHTVEEQLRNGKDPFTFTDEERGLVLRDYDETGFGFYPSITRERCPGDPSLPENSNLGNSVSSRAWVGKQLEQTPDLDLLLYVECGWLGQDVVACSRGGKVGLIAEQMQGEDGQSPR